MADPSLFVWVTDPVTGKIKRIAVPADFQIGSSTVPAELQLFGRLSLATKEYAVSTRSPTATLDNESTVANISITGSPTRITCNLPGSPRDGQVHFIKDITGNAGSYPIDVKPPSGTLIDGNTSTTISSNYGSVAVYFYSDSWYVLVSGGQNIVGGTGISVSNNGSSVTITATGVVQGAADVSASYVVIGNTGSLPNERALVAGSNITITDNGPNSSVVIAATAGAGNAPNSSAFVTIGNDASLTAERALTAGTGISITDGGANSTVTIASTITQGAPLDGAFVMIGNNGSTTAERALTAGTGISISDGGANSTVTISTTTSAAPDSATYVTLSGDTGLTSERVLTAGAGIRIVDNGANSTVVISTTGAGAADVSASYVVIGATGSLPNERVITAGSGISITDNGAGSSIVIAATGGSGGGADVSASYIVVGVTGSLPNERALAAGPGISISDGGAGGSITISSVVRESADVSASYITISTTGSLPNERALAAGTGILITDNGAGSTVSVSINNSVVATVSGATFTGVVSGTAGFSGSLTQVGPGIPFLLAQGGITLTTTSLGQVIISGSNGSNNSGAPSTAQYLVLTNDSTLSAERAFTAGTGLTGTDGGANSTFTLAINNNVVATVSGTSFSGPVTASVGLSASHISLGTLPATNGTVRLSNGGSIVGQDGAGSNYNQLSWNAYSTVVGIAAGAAVVLNQFGALENWVGSTKVANFSSAQASVNVPFTASSGISGSLTQVAPNIPYLLSQGGITLTTQSNGSIIISGAYQPNLAPYAPLAGATFTGVVSGAAGFSGSLTQVGPGIPYLLSQGGITLTTTSLGQIIISGSTGGGGGTSTGGGDPNASYVVLGTTGSLTNERVLTAGFGVNITDTGANGTVTLSLVTGSNRIDSTSNDIIIWRLNELTGNTIVNYGSSGSIANLTGSSQLVYGRAGVYDSAIDFRGYNTPTFATSSNSVCPTGTNFSVAAWVYPYQFMTGVIVMKNYTNSTYDPSSPIILGITGSMGRPFAQIRTQGSTTNYVVTAESRSLGLGTWNHIGFTVSGSYANLYLNGDRVETISISGNVDYGAGNGWWSVGGLYTGAQSGDYKLNEVLISNSIKDDLWWRNIYNKGLRGTTVSSGSSGTSNGSVTTVQNGANYGSYTDVVAYSARPSTQSTTFIRAAMFEFDPSRSTSAGTGTRTIKFRVIAESTGPTATIQLYNVTSGSVVSNSTLTTTSTTSSLLTTSDITSQLSTGSAIYEVQMKMASGLSTDIINVGYAGLRIEWS